MSLRGLRLALVGPLPPPAGGMANQTRQLAQLLAQEGVAVNLVAVNAPYRPTWLGRWWGVRALARLLPYLVALWRTCGRVQLVHVMANSGWSWHLYAAPAVWLARWHGVPVVLNYRGGEADAFFARSFRWVRPTLARVDRIIVPSGFLQQVFQKYAVPAGVVPNIIDLGRFTPPPARPPGPYPRLVVARHLEPIYDIATAIRAFAAVHRQFPAARLTVAGSGSQRAALEQLTAALGLTAAVTFTGNLDNARMVDLYRQADLMLNASRVDNLPISLLEALACGVPVVSTRAGGIPFLVEDGRTALLVPPADSAALAAAALRLLTDSTLAQALRCAGQDLVQHYTWPAVRQRLAAVYAELAVTPQGG